MKKTLLLIVSAFLFALPLSASALGQQQAGKILLQVEDHGEAWYIHPDNFKRYYLRDGEAAYTIMRFLSLGITDVDLATIPSVADTTEMNNSTSACSSNSLANRLKGNILLQVEQNGEAWYIDVEKCRRIYLKDGAAAYDVMRFLGLGITNNDLSRISIHSDSVLPEGVEPPPPSVGSHELREVAAKTGFFGVDIITIDLTTPGLQIVTDAVSDVDCDTNCPVLSLGDYVTSNNGFAGIHGSYFCPADYSGCANEVNYFFYPIYDSVSGNLINEDQLKWPTTGPFWIFDTDNKVHFLSSTQDFGSVSEFEAKKGVKIQAAIGNLPPLVMNGINVVGSQTLDDKQRNTKSSRGGIAVKGDTLYLLIAHGATVVDLANVMEALEVDQGMNLDGGGSSALYFEGEYKVGPGRAIPNAIVFKTAS